MNLVRFSQARAGTTDLTIALSLGSAAAGIAGCTMVPAVGDGETVAQEIQVRFKGTQAQIESAMQTLGRMLASAAVEAAKPYGYGKLVYLECQVAPADTIWRSPILSGKMELARAGVDQRSIGSQGVKLALVRSNWWETKDEIYGIDEQAVYNHHDSGHTNLQSFLEASGGDLPAPAHLTSRFWDEQPEPGALFAAEWVGGSDTLDWFFEAEEGAAGPGVSVAAVTDASGSSGGSYRNYTWSGTAETRVWSVTVAAGKVASAGGRPMRVMLRLGDSIPALLSEKYWARWQLAVTDYNAGEQVIYESTAAYLDQAKELIQGPVVYLPPWANVGESGSDVKLILLVSAYGGGANSLKLDWVDLAPLDGWRYYDPILMADDLVVDDWGQQGMTGPLDMPPTHLLEGPGFMIYPGKYHSFFYYWALKGASEMTARADITGVVRVAYRPRKRVL